MKATKMVYDLIEANVREGIDCLIDEGELNPCEDYDVYELAEPIREDIWVRGFVIGYANAKKLIEEITDVNIFDMINTLVFEYEMEVKDYETLANGYFDHVMNRDNIVEKIIKEYLEEKYECEEE